MNLYNKTNNHQKFPALFLLLITFIGGAIFSLTTSSCKPKGAKKPGFSQKPPNDRDDENDSDDNNKDDNKNKKNNSKTFLSSSDFSQESDEIRRADFDAVIQEIKAAFYHVNPKNGNKPDVDDCTKKTWADNDVEIKDDSIESKVKVDRCTATFKDLKITLDFEGKTFKRCNKNGFKKLVGKSDKEVLSSDHLEYCKSAEVEEFLNVKMDYRNEDTRGRANDITMMIAKMRNNGNPCVIKTSSQSATIESGCGYYYKISNSHPRISAKNIVFKGKLDDVKISFGRSFYSDGSMSFTLNNWSGKVTFSGSNPRYEAQSNKGENVSGTIK